MPATPLDLTQDDTGQSIGTFVAGRVQELLDSMPVTRIEGLYPALMRDVERALLMTVLDHVGGKRQDAARILGMHRNSLRLRLRATGLDDLPFSEPVGD